MIKIAIASEKDIVAEHFGHCQNFTVYTIKENEVINVVSIPNPGHRPGFLPLFLKELGICLIISGGIGQSAVSLFNEHGIEVIVGAKGNVSDVIKEFLKGRLESTKPFCQKG
ncbi:MAG: NifB/NifX family molybdenum-iron cluster-binding protein [Bacilli bacterium]|jgi:predicted Fe-Mo cluster-binding NifX family protein|nr:NifB/NifX family molybdenum-iron cluster-binding protein [Bacilli bacterium]